MIRSTPELALKALDAAPDAMMLIAHDGVVWFANRQVAALFGYLPEEFIGKRLDQFASGCLASGIASGEECRKNFRVMMLSAAAGLIGRRADGSGFPVEMKMSPIAETDGSYVVVMRDVTEQKRVEAESIAAREDANRASQAKSRFVATASHDLRQPVQALALLNGILRRTVAESKAADALNQQEQAIGAMTRLLNALLDVSKLESGGVKPQQSDFAVAVVFDGLRRDFANLAESKGLALQVEECGEWVHSDRSLVEQILRNIVSNAIKYTRNGCVRLRSLHAHARVRIEVLDTGIGIPEDQLRYIYDEFYQVGCTTAGAREGFGLGLSIVQRLVNLLALRLDVHSEVGRGSAFSLELPLGVLRDGPLCDDAESRRAPQVRTDRPRILLVEDDAAVRAATGLLLQGEGYHVSAVCSLEEALRSARNGSGLDLLLTDYHLSDGEKGTEVIAALRESLGSSLKAVLITADTSSAIKNLPRDRNLRVTSKPVKADELLILLRELLAA